LIAQIYPRILRDEPVKLFKSHKEGINDGEQSRDFIWIEDCIDVMIWLYENRNVSGLFNVGTGQARSFKNLTEAVYHSLKREPKIDFVETPLHLRDQYQYFTQASMKKLKSAGYKNTFTTLEDGVQKYVENFLSTDNPYR
jgi:ADP-L-glycero-D-manno-heptose 6-epimerase